MYFQCWDILKEKKSVHSLKSQIFVLFNINLPLLYPTVIATPDLYGFHDNIWKLLYKVDVSEDFIAYK